MLNILPETKHFEINPSGQTLNNHTSTKITLNITFKHTHSESTCKFSCILGAPVALPADCLLLLPVFTLKMSSLFYLHFILMGI